MIQEYTRQSNSSLLLLRAMHPPEYILGAVRINVVDKSKDLSGSIIDYLYVEQSAPSILGRIIHAALNASTVLLKPEAVLSGE